MVFYTADGLLWSTVEPLIAAISETKPSGRCFRGDRCGEVLLYVYFLLKKTGRKRWEGRLNE